MSLLGVGLLLAALPHAARAAPAWQAATATFPVNRVEVIEDFANIRAGPGTDYDLIGRLNRGEMAEIVGQAQNGPYLWLKVIYIVGPNNQGWVNANAGAVKVTAQLDAIPTLPIPPTPTVPPPPTQPGDFPNGTATPDSNAGRLPTFTPPPAIVRPTLLPAIGAASERGFPPALAIISLLVLGVFGLLVSLMRQRT
jgi:hypothetical protein